MQKILYYLTILLAMGGGICEGVFLGTAIRNNLDLKILIIGLALLLASLLLGLITCLINFNPQGVQNRSRYNKTISLSQEEAEDKINLILEKNKFHLIKYGKEDVYQSGKVIISNRKFLKINYRNNKIVIDGWISLGFKNKPNKEYSLDDNSFFLRGAKVTLLKTIEEILNEVY